MSDQGKLTDEDKQKLDTWKQQFKDEWDYRRKQVVYKDSHGNIYTPPTTKAPTDATQKPTNATTEAANTTVKKPLTVVTTTPVNVINTTIGGNTGRVSQADSTNILKVVGITIGGLLGVVILVVIVLAVCRRSTAKKKDRRISLRRPLHQSEPEEHIYAEIEQFQRTESPSGASGDSGDSVPLPSKKGKKRHSGISSFRAISTRIYRFFSSDQTENQTVCHFDRSQQQATIHEEVPEPPERELSNGRRKRRGRGVDRFESTTSRDSRRPLLDGNSSATSSAEIRSNIYNPLIRNNENRASGPYDTLARAAQNRESESSPDYLPIAEAIEGADGVEPGAESESASDNPAKSDYFVLENETKMTTIDEAGNDESAEKDSEPPKNHDYFVLEPHEREPTEDTNNSPSKASKKGSVKSSQSETNSNDINRSPVKGNSKPKPTVKPRITKSPSGENAEAASKDNIDSPSETDSLLNKSIEASANQYVPLGGVTKDEAVSENPAPEKDEDYILSKFGEAPVPPEAAAEEDSDYLCPTKQKEKPDYVDVFPNPPPRTSSLQNTPEHTVKDPAGHDVNQSPEHEINHSPERKLNKSPDRKSSKSPEHKSRNSPSRKLTKSPSHQAADKRLSTETTV